MTTLNEGDRVTLTDPTGDQLTGCIVSVDPLGWSLDLQYDWGDVAGFELGTDGRWYEINDSQTPWTLLPVLGGAR